MNETAALGDRICELAAHLNAANCRLLELIAALVPRPRTHLVRYHGLFAPNAKHRDHIVATVTPRAQCADDTLEAKPNAPMSWMQRLRRVFAIDISTCPRCGGKVRVIAAITQPAFLAYCLHITLAQQLRAHAGGLTPRSVLEKFAAVQMLDVHIPTTDGRELVLTRYTEPEKELKLLLERLELELPAQPPPKITVPQVDAATSV